MKLFRILIIAAVLALPAIACDEGTVAFNDDNSAATVRPLGDALGIADAIERAADGANK